MRQQAHHDASAIERRQRKQVEHEKNYVDENSRRANKQQPNRSRIAMGEPCAYIEQQRPDERHEKIAERACRSHPQHLALGMA